MFHNLRDRRVAHVSKIIHTEAESSSRCIYKSHFGEMKWASCIVRRWYSPSMRLPGLNSQTTGHKSMWSLFLVLVHPTKEFCQVIRLSTNANQHLRFRFALQKVNEESLLIVVISLNFTFNFKLLHFHAGADECNEQTHNCHKNADCVDLPKGFNCSCKSGFSGDGQTCEGNEKHRLFTVELMVLPNDISSYVWISSV